MQTHTHSHAQSGSERYIRICAHCVWRLYWCAHTASAERPLKEKQKRWQCRAGCRCAWASRAGRWVKQLMSEQSERANERVREWEIERTAASTTTTARCNKQTTYISRFVLLSSLPLLLSTCTRARTRTATTITAPTYTHTHSSVHWHIYTHTRTEWGHILSIYVHVAVSLRRAQPLIAQQTHTVHCCCCRSASAAAASAPLKRVDSKPTNHHQGKWASTAGL